MKLMETPANDRQSSRNNQNNRYKFIICILEKVHTSSLYLSSCTTLWLPSGPRSCWKSIALHRRRTAAAASRSQNGRAAGTVGIAPGGARGGSRGGEGPAARWPVEETARRRRQALARGPRWNLPALERGWGASGAEQARGGGDAAAARGESLGTLGPKLRMDGGEMYAPYYAARAPKVGPRRRDPAAGRADSAGPGSIRTLWFWRAGATRAA